MIDKSVENHNAQVNFGKHFENRGFIVIFTLDVDKSVEDQKGFQLYS